VILGPNDPRAIRGKELEEAREYTKQWRDFLGVKPMTVKQKAKYDADLAAVLDLIGYKEEE
jgi:hypothetical protein